MTPLSRVELDKLVCSIPGCKEPHGHGPLFLHAVCHPKQPQFVRYCFGGILELRCAVCQLATAEILIAAEHQVEMDEQLVCKDPSCEEPQEDHGMQLRPPCHRDAGAYVVYNDGHLFIQCGECQLPVGGVLHVKPASAEA